MSKSSAAEFLKDADQYQSMSAEVLLAELVTKFGLAFKQANSLGPEDLVIMHILHGIDARFRSFMLDTGRLNPETYDLLGRLQENYKLDIQIMFPAHNAVEEMVRTKGINLFYESAENRKQCCFIRKVEPLGRALSDVDVWITGLRQEQSPTRAQVRKVEADPGNPGKIKINPLADWSRTEVWDFIKKNRIPYNKLHDQNYLSIGCAPCTRAVQAGESERAGRWWWENPESKECGLHVKK